MSHPKIISIAACPIPGDRRTFANVYGVDDRGDLFQWNIRSAEWELAQLKERGERSGGRR